MYRLANSWKRMRFIAMATKTGNTDEQRSKTKTVGMYKVPRLCPWKRVCRYCVDGTSAKWNNQIARDIMRFLLSSMKNDQKNNTKPCMHICVEFAFSALWAAQTLQTGASTYLSVDLCELSRAFLNYKVTFKKCRKKRIDTAILMVNIDHQEPATRTGMYKPWR